MPPAVRRVKWRPICHVTSKLPSTPRRGVPPSCQRYSRCPIRAVECVGGLRVPKDPWKHHAARLGRYRRRTWLYRPLVRGCELRGRTRRFGREGGWRHFIYPLSLAIYCTSWTFFGSVGLASRTGFDFLTIYIGPILLVGLCSPLIM